MRLFPEEWRPILEPHSPLFELVVRSSLLYLALLALMRLILRRSSGNLAMMDLVFVFLLTQAASNSLGDYHSLFDGLVVIITIIGWNYLINFLSYQVLFIERMVTPPPLQVVRNGKLLRRNMRSEFLTVEELTHQIRQQGIEDIAEIKAAYIEEGGSISIVRRKGHPANAEGS